MTYDIYRAPSGAAEAQFQQEKRDAEVSQEYLDRIDKGIQQEIGWIIGDVPKYQGVPYSMD